MTTRVILSILTGTALLLACTAWAAQRAETGALPLPADRPLSAQELRGEGLFLQRCSLCHLPKRAKVCCQAPLGPLLYGVLKPGDAARERLVREQMLRGSANMPGFQAGFDERDIEDVVAYLKAI